MKKSNELTLGEAIREFLKVNDLDEKLHEKEIYARWEEFVGRQINVKTRKIHLEKGVLTIYLTSSVLRNELNLRKTKMLESINMRLKDDMKIRELLIK